MLRSVINETSRKKNEKERKNNLMKHERVVYSAAFHAHAAVARCT